MTALYELAGRCFCVSFARVTDVRRCHAIGQSVMLDNGAFSAWTEGRATNWAAFYEWIDEWLPYPTTWAVIPDVIDGGAEAQDRLISEWPYGIKGSPVWHMDEPIDRLRLALPTRVAEGLHRLNNHIRRGVLSRSRGSGAVDDDAFDALVTAAPFSARGPTCCAACCRRTLLSAAHSACRSTAPDIACNHNRPQNSPREMADRWDRQAIPGGGALAKSNWS